MRTTPARHEVHYLEDHVLGVSPTRPSEFTAQRFKLAENDLAIGLPVMQLVVDDVAERKQGSR